MKVFTTYKYLILPLLLNVPLYSVGSDIGKNQTLDAFTVIEPHKKGLKNALSDLDIRFKEVIQADKLSYREQLSDINGNKLTRYYNANLPLGNRWTHIEITGEDISQSQLQINIPILLSPSTMTSGQLNFYREDEKYWIFSIKTSVTAENEGRRLERLEEATNKLQSNLNTFVYVDKQTQQFTRFKIVNSKPFKASMLVKIEVFSIIVDYSEAWEAGPLVAINSIRKLKGSYGLFIEIDEQLNQQLSQFSFKQ